MTDLLVVPDIDPNIHKVGNYRKITQWQVDFCGGDFVEAILLSFFIAMYHRQRNILIEGLRKYATHGISLRQTDSIELVFSYREISNYIFNITQQKNILRNKISSLESRGVITTKKALTTKDKLLYNLDAKLSTDRSNVYIFHPTPIIEYLKPYLSQTQTLDGEIQLGLDILKRHGYLVETNGQIVFKKPLSGATSHQTKKPQPVSKKNPASKIAKAIDETQSAIDAWNEFLSWAKNHLTVSSRDILKTIKPKFDGASITINHELPQFLEDVILHFFKENFEGENLVIFEKQAL